MKSRATWNRRPRSCAWAFLAALLPAAEAWAEGESTISASPANVATEGASTSIPKPRKASSARPKIPPPRKFTTDATPSPESVATPTAAPIAGAITDSSTAAAPALALEPAPAPAPAAELVPAMQGDPSKISAAAALLNSPAPAEPALEAVPPTVPAPALTQAAASEPAAPSAPLSQGDPSRIAAAAALLNVSDPTQSAAEAPPAVASPELAPVPNGQPSSLAAGAVAPVENFAAPAEPAPQEASVPAAENVAAPTAPAAEQPTSPAGESAMAAVMQSATPAAATSIKSDATVEKTGCATCGGFHSTLDGPGFHGSFGCATGQCVPGRKGCSVPANECDTIVGSFLQNLWQCLCCPDPCYQPQWVPAANASFFVDYARPRTITRLRFDRLMDMTHPDRNQFFMKNPITSPITLPNSNRPNSRFQGKFLANPSLNMSQFTLYQEAASERASLFFEMPYRQNNFLVSQTEAGFADLNFGSKALLFDCEMLQVSFQFRTFMPSGNAQIGLGTGHVSLDPSLLASLKLAPDTYLQAQLGNWIPLGGTSNIAGGMAYWFMSLNQVLAYITPDSPLIGTFEFDGWSFQNGGYTPAFIPAGSNAKNYVSSGGGVSYFNLGPGLRMSVCNKVDFGGAITWATTANHWADPWFRFEMRILF